MKNVQKQVNSDFLLLGILVIEIIIMSFMSSRFFTVYNLLNMFRHFVERGIVALVMTFIILTAGIDLSVGSMIGMNAMIFGVLETQIGLNIWIACFIILIIGTCAGAFNGAITTRIGIPPLVVTLATMSMYRGLAYSVSKAKTFSGFSESFAVIGQGTIGNTEVPNQLIIFIGLAILFHIIIKYTSYGRKVYVIGNNDKCALFSGINVNSIKLSLYTISGFLCALSALIMVSRVSAARADLGTGFELDVITAVLVGGTSIRGGKGSISATVLGLLIIVVLTNGLSLAGFSTVIRTIVVGLVLIISVYLRTLREARQ
jgi:rhamnose transport system permease protein